jgi:DNA-binding NarL/FixJ family response regulator
MSSQQPLEARPDNQKYRVLIVDDHPVVRQGLAQLVNQESDLMVCGIAGNALQALELVTSSQPDVVIVDLALEGHSGLELVKDLRARFPKLPVLVLSMHEESLYAERALRAGARGYIMKEEPTDRVMQALRRLLTGDIYLSDRMAGRLLQKMVSGRGDAQGSLVEQLTDRELEVFQLIGRGLGTRDIAEQLHLSVKTIETHRENIKRKLSLDSAVELHQHAFMWAQRGMGGEATETGETRSDG